MDFLWGAVSSVTSIVNDTIIKPYEDNIQSGVKSLLYKCGVKKNGYYSLKIYNDIDPIIFECLLQFFSSSNEWLKNLTFITTKQNNNHSLANKIEIGYGKNEIIYNNNTLTIERKRLENSSSDIIISEEVTLTVKTPDEEIHSLEYIKIISDILETSLTNYINKIGNHIKIIDYTNYIFLLIDILSQYMSILLYIITR